MPRNIALAELPSTVAVFDSTLLNVTQTIVDSPIDSASALIALPSNREKEYIFFSPRRMYIYSGEFSLLGVSAEGMEYERTGVNRFSGAVMRNGYIFCAQTAGGGVCAR